MLLQKTGWRIRQFIHRRRHSLEDASEDDCLIDRRESLSTPRRLPWRLSQITSPDFPPLRRATSALTSRSQPMPPQSQTAYSSVSSLCSCDCNTNHGPIEYSLSEPASVAKPVGILYLQPLFEPSASGDAKTWRLIFPAQSPQQSSSLSKLGTIASLSDTTIRESSFDLHETLTRGTAAFVRDRTPTQSIRNFEDLNMDTLSTDVDQLIRETDEAFKAVGSALADAKAATQGWYDTPGDAHIKRKTTTYHSISRKNSGLQTSPLKNPVPRSVLSSTPGKRNKSVKKRKKNITQKALRTNSIAPANTPPRWTLTDVTASMMDGFGKMFRPREVDEMLCPKRILQLRSQLRVESDRKFSQNSAQSIDTDSSDTPVEPFYLERLSSCIDAARLKAPPSSSPILSPPELPIKTQAPIYNNPYEVSPQSDDNSLLINQFPLPPTEVQLQRSRSISKPSLFPPTIPEVSPFSITSTSPAYQFTKTHVDLPSTPYTFTSPYFRHGPIRFERGLPREREHERNLKLRDEPRSILKDTEEPLDWTAFQMAILGTMDEPDANPDADADNEWEGEDMDRDEIMTWWESFKIGSTGHLVGPDEAMLEEISMELDEDNDTHMSTPSPETLGAASMMQGLDIEDRSPLPLHLNKYIPQARKRISELSMPPSPMQNLMLGEVEADGKAEVEFREVIPMGFNLGHDLGDFLRWDTAHVRQSGRLDW